MDIYCSDKRGHSLPFSSKRIKPLTARSRFITPSGIIQSAASIGWRRASGIGLRNPSMARASDSRGCSTMTRPSGRVKMLRRRYVRHRTRPRAPGGGGDGTIKPGCRAMSRHRSPSAECDGRRRSGHGCTPESGTRGPGIAAPVALPVAPRVFCGRCRVDCLWHHRLSAAGCRRKRCGGRCLARGAAHCRARNGRLRLPPMFPR